MSLEEALYENTAAVREQTALLRELSVAIGKLIVLSQPVPVEVDRRKSDDHKEVAEKVIETAKTFVPDFEKLKKPRVEEETAPAAEEKPVDLMTDIVPVFQKLCVAKGRDAGAGILAKWNVAKLSQVPADKLGELLSDIQKAAA